MASSTSTPSPSPPRLSTGSHSLQAAHDAPPTLYFAYGSNLSPTQIAARCPTARLLGPARLHGRWRWTINERGYANVVRFRARAKPCVPTAGVVYGLVYALRPADEAALDACEGVPWSYEKAFVAARLWPATGVNAAAAASSSPFSSTAVATATTTAEATPPATNSTGGAGAESSGGKSAGRNGQRSVGGEEEAGEGIPDPFLAAHERNSEVHRTLEEDGGLTERLDSNGRRMSLVDGEENGLRLQQEEQSSGGDGEDMEESELGEGGEEVEALVYVDRRRI